MVLSNSLPLPAAPSYTMLRSSGIISARTPYRCRGGNTPSPGNPIRHCRGGLKPEAAGAGAEAASFLPRNTQKAARGLQGVGASPSTWARLPRLNPLSGHTDVGFPN